MSKCKTDTNESVKLSSQFISDVCGRPDILDFVNDRPRNTFFLNRPSQINHTSYPTVSSVQKFGSLIFYV